ncbi:MAG: hypothetical protein EOP05_03045 [Proteobacteria bacterium]|nr:MAG: hypothetical protein EOP05_03045 [Pseudomonadota bacterium]
MKRKIQIVLSEDAWELLESTTKESNTGFKNGSITYSDVVNEFLVGGKIDIRMLQAKHTNLRKSLRLMASQKEIDIDAAIRSLQELKAKTAKRPAKVATQIEADV